jgi:hypothetical protein
MSTPAAASMIRINRHERPHTNKNQNERTREKNLISHMWHKPPLGTQPRAACRVIACVPDCECDVCQGIHVHLEQTPRARRNQSMPH